MKRAARSSLHLALSFGAAMLTTGLRTPSTMPGEAEARAADEQRLFELAVARETAGDYC